jgi:hypothetical protein
MVYKRKKIAMLYNIQSTNIQVEIRKSNLVTTLHRRTSYAALPEHEESPSVEKQVDYIVLH